MKEVDLSLEWERFMYCLYYQIVYYINQLSDDLSNCSVSECHNIFIREYVVTLSFLLFDLAKWNVLVQNSPVTFDFGRYK